MEQSTAGDQPLWLSASQNGLDTADFDGSRWVQTDDAVNNVPSVSQPVTYFWVTYIPGSTGERWLFDRGSGWEGNYTDSRQNSGKSSNTQWFSAGTSWTLDNTDQWSYITTIFNGASGLLRENGVANSANPRDTGPRKISAGTIGAASSPSDPETWDEEIGEIIMYDRELSTSEIEGIEAYLANRWGL
jgi:hypothetical protein